MYPCMGEFSGYQEAISRVGESSDKEEEEPEPNYVHAPCGTEKYIEGAHRVIEHAWCEEAEDVVRFRRIE